MRAPPHKDCNISASLLTSLLLLRPFIGSSEFLRLINAAEQTTVLEDWAARSRIYRMSDNDDLRDAHTKAVEEMEELAAFDTSGPPGENGRKMVLGLFAEDQIKAVAGAEVSHESGLVVTSSMVGRQIHEGQWG